MTEHENIAIKSKEAFQQTLDSLSTLHDQLGTRIADGKKISTTVAGEAGKDVTAGASPQGDSSTVAPAYRSAVSALDTAVGEVGAQAQAAGTSLQTALTDLGALLQGLSTIDNDGADKVKGQG